MFDSSLNYKLDSLNDLQKPLSWQHLLAHRISTRQGIRDSMKYPFSEMKILLAKKSHSIADARQLNAHAKILKELHILQELDRQDFLKKMPVAIASFDKDLLTDFEISFKEERKQSEHEKGIVEILEAIINNSEILIKEKEENAFTFITKKEAIDKATRQLLDEFESKYCILS